MRPQVHRRTRALKPKVSVVTVSVLGDWPAVELGLQAGVCKSPPISAYNLRAMKKWIIATLLIATAAVAQQTHNQYEPPDAPGAGQKLLSQFAGDWDLVKTFFPMNGKPIVTKGMCKQYMIQDGKFLQSDFTFFNADGTKSAGTGISGFDSKTNRFTTVWYDSRQTTMSIRQSDGTFDGKNIVLWATALDPDRPWSQDGSARAP
jgi:hypothetical protein